MYEALTTMHKNTPETYKRNNSNKTIDGIWITQGVTPLAAGYLDYDDWDHRLLWIDFKEKQLFGHKEL